MRLNRKLAFIATAALLALFLAIGLVLPDTRFARWVYEDGGRTSEPLLKRAGPAWGVDASRYNYAGVHSTKGWVIVHRWEHRDRQTEVVDVTPVEGLVCYAKRNNNSSEYRNIGCVHYPE